MFWSQIGTFYSKQASLRVSWPSESASQHNQSLEPKPSIQEEPRGHISEAHRTLSRPAQPAGLDQGCAQVFMSGRFDSPICEGCQRALVYENYI